MTIRLDEALATALEFERKVLAVYEEAATQAADPVGRRVFQHLAREEAGHVAYLKSRLAEWQQCGHLSQEALASAVPSRERIAAGRKAMAKPLQGNPASAIEAEYLRKALAAERETSAFYRTMVGEVAEEQRQLFARFLEIEEGHVAIVEAELDAVTGSGFWFGIKEFDLEKG